MARIKNISRNLNAFLDMIAWCEGTSTNKLTKNDGYDVIVSGISGPEIFTDYSNHPFANGRPSKPINSKGLTSNAAGRGQIMLKWWLIYKPKLGLKDFSPESQDLYCINQLREQNAIDAIENGDIKLAIARCSNIWASLPGANYKDQNMRSLNDCISVFIAKGGKCSQLQPSSAQSPQSLPVSVPPISVENQKVSQTPQSSNPKSILSVLSNLIARLLTRK